MKYIKIVKHNANFNAIMMDDPSKLAEPLKEHVEWLKRLQEDGILLEGWFMPGEGKTFMVFECNSSAELDNIILQDPMEFTFDAEVYPAIPLFDHIEDAFNAKIGK